MRLTIILMIVIFAAVAVGFFTKPSNRFCEGKAKDVVLSNNQTVPGYDQPLSPEGRQGINFFRDDQIMIKDRFLWKEISYVSSSTIQLVGYGYLNNFHKVSEKKAQ